MQSYFWDVLGDCFRWGFRNGWETAEDRFPRGDRPCAGGCSKVLHPRQPGLHMKAGLGRELIAAFHASRIESDRDGAVENSIENSIFNIFMLLTATRTCQENPMISMIEDVERDAHALYSVGKQ